MLLLKLRSVVELQICLRNKISSAKIWFVVKPPSNARLLRFCICWFYKGLKKFLRSIWKSITLWPHCLELSHNFILHSNGWIFWGKGVFAKHAASIFCFETVRLLTLLLEAANPCRFSFYPDNHDKPIIINVAEIFHGGYVRPTSIEANVHWSSLCFFSLAPHLYVVLSAFISSSSFFLFFVSAPELFSFHFTCLLGLHHFCWRKPWHETSPNVTGFLFSSFLLKSSLALSWCSSTWTEKVNFLSIFVT